MRMNGFGSQSGENCSIFKFPDELIRMKVNYSKYLIKNISYIISVLFLCDVYRML